MIVLRNYDATDGNARIIKVRNVAKTTVFDVY